MNSCERGVLSRLINMARHVGQFARFKGVTEEQREQRREQQHKKQHPPIPIDVQELFVSDAGSRFE